MSDLTRRELITGALAVMFGGIVPDVLTPEEAAAEPEFGGLTVTVTMDAGRVVKARMDGEIGPPAQLSYDPDYREVTDSFGVPVQRYLTGVWTVSVHGSGPIRYVIEEVAP
jgi:hypothetical protein